MNSYNIYDENDRYAGNVPCLYHAIARDEEQVKELAAKAGVKLDGLTVDLERENVKDELGRPYSPKIESALV